MELYFFLIGNKKILLRKIANPSKTRREKQEKCGNAALQTRRVCKKKDLISSKDCSHPSKHLAFRLLQIHHIK